MIKKNERAIIIIIAGANIFALEVTMKNRIQQ